MIKWQKASSARSLQRTTTDLTTPQSSNPPSSSCADHVAAQFEVSQRWALRKHSCKTLCPGFVYHIVAEIEVSQRCALRKDS
jgi:hypothetical protein